MIILSLVPNILLGQEKEDYEKEEIAVFNQFLYKLIDAERLSKFNKTDSSLVLYFQTGLDCNLKQSYKGEYKPNKLLQQLEDYNMNIRFIDSTRIAKLENVEFIFGRTNMYPIEKYDSIRVIGTISFSRVSFNKTLTEGYFYYDVYCGEDCGWGDLIKIKKRNGTWEISESLSSWVS